MLRLIASLLLRCLLVLAAWPVQAQNFAWDAQALPSSSLGRYVQVLREYGTPWTVAQALERFAQTNPPPLRDEVLSFGIGAAPVWLLLPLHNDDPNSLRMHLLLGTTWMDSADAYVVRAGKVRSHLHLGDEVPYAYGVVPGFGFEWELELPPQRSALLVRVQSLDPLVLPLQLLDAAALASEREGVQYGYELLFGALFALVLYNLALFMVARNPLYVRYALYVSTMLLLCIAYTGKGLASWWPQSPGFQRYVILCAMVLFNLVGLNFAVHFLHLRQHLPRLGRLLRWSQWGVLGGLVLWLALDRHLAAVWWAFSVFLAATVVLFGVGAWAAWTRQPSGRLFFAAVSTSMAGAAIAWLAVTGVVGFSMRSLHLMEVGFLVDAALLAIALGQRILAEKNARAPGPPVDAEKRPALGGP
jgi:hypothetical protein